MWAIIVSYLAVFCGDVKSNSFRLNRIPRMYVFNWDEIPGKDSERFLEFLTQNFGIQWVKTAKITKFDEGKTLKVSTEKASISLKLNDKETEFILEIDDLRTNKFIAKLENRKLNIYQRIKKWSHGTPEESWDLWHDGWAP